LNNSISNINSTNISTKSEITPVLFGIKSTFAAGTGDIIDADLYCGGAGLLVGIGLSYAGAAACSALSASGVLE